MGLTTPPLRSETAFLNQNDMSLIEYCLVIIFMNSFCFYFIHFSRNKLSQVSHQRAEATLAQFYVGHTPLLHPFGTALQMKTLRCDKPSSVQAINTVEHYLLKCSGKAASRRATLPEYQERKNMKLPDIIRKWPRMVLAYLEREGYFDSELPTTR